MDFIRTARNPWGEEVLLGLAWDVLWLVVIAGALFVIIHAVFAKKSEPAAPPSVDPRVIASIPPKVQRHTMSARISHWILAVATFALLITAFVPILGLQFPWLTIHWVAGIVLTLYVIYHTVDTLMRGTWGEMWMGGREIRESVDRVKDFFARREDPEKRPGKWGAENKIFHHITGLAGVGVVVTGVLMMARVDTWFWQSNPYIFGLSDSLWGWIFLLHGLTAVGFVGLLIAHIYFAVRPDKLWITRSMFKGWITRDEYLEHHHPERWPVTDEAARAAARSDDDARVGAGAATTAPMKPSEE